MTNTMMIALLAQKYDAAERKVQKSPLSVAKVHQGVYLASDADGQIWQISNQVESPGKPWIAQSYPVSVHSEYTDPWATKKDVLIDIGFES